MSTENTSEVIVDNASLLAEIERLKAENAALAAAKVQGPRSLTLKVSEKGAISIYGLGRFPVTLYKGQAERVFTAEFCAKVHEFIAAHPELKTKE
jgi:hypothetical protein